MSVIETDPADLSELSGLDVDRLEAQICALAARRAAEECVWLELIAEFDRRERFDAWECRSTAHWLNWHCGLSMPAARERVRVARALEGLPRLAEVFAAGRVTYSKVRAVTRVATAAIEEMLVELALAGTATQLDRICSAYRRVRRYEDDRARLRSAADEEEAEADARAALVGVSSWHDDDGMWRLRAAILPEDGALVDAALASAVEHLSDAACCSNAPAGAPDEPPDQPDQPDQTGGPGGSGRPGPRRWSSWPGPTWRRSRSHPVWSAGTWSWWSMWARSPNTVSWASTATVAAPSTANASPLTPPAASACPRRSPPSSPTTAACPCRSDGAPATPPRPNASPC